MKRTGKLHENDPVMCDDSKGEFVTNLDQINKDLRDLGLAILK